MILTDRLAIRSSTSAVVLNSLASRPELESVHARSVYLTFPYAVKLNKRTTQPLVYDSLSKRYLPDPTLTLIFDLGRVGELRQLIDLTPEEDVS
nr:MAG: wsv432-like protein [Penaeus semisulcatus pemonivirus]